ncbi:hypothetical protein D0Y65_012211 [Glycine soja]|uniref:Integrase catalytic domain-containing protein n=1 Tax=Glycine soja TaxID=3848 RepID=A0A445KN06_GLYSO|nr:hypothetical protein D0Y65_012211 [Glycine soja]
MTNDSSKMISKFAKLDKFEGQDFRRWQKKMHFLLTTLKVVYVLSTPMPVFMEDETLDQTRKRSKWENDDYICRGHILNGMSDSLFDIYQNVESAKELWDSLESKYMAEDASSNKFLVSNFFNYKMIDSRSVMEQYNELLRILGQFTQHDLKMDESIAVSSIIDKLPSSWKYFKHTLKHKKEELTLVQLDSHFMIEESLRAQEIDKVNDKNVASSSFVNMVEESGTVKQNYNAKDDDVAWWFDSGATSHVCKDRRWFKEFRPIDDGSIVKMDYVATEPILGLAPYTPQQNGVTERKNRTLKEMVNSMLSYSGLSEGFWGEAMLTACYLLNRIPNKRNKVEVERIQGKAHDKLTNKLAAARHKAEEKRAAAEANRNHQAAKTEEQAEYIRRTGHVPSSYLSFSCCNWCS